MEVATEGELSHIVHIRLHLAYCAGGLEEHKMRMSTFIVLAAAIVLARAKLCLGDLTPGQLVAWGWNSYDQLTVPAGSDFVAVDSSFWWHSLALRADGSVVSWGWNPYGELNVPAGPFQAISGGTYYTVGLTGIPEPLPAPVPAPGALILAVFGLSHAGWRLRRCP